MSKFFLTGIVDSLKIAVVVGTLLCLINQSEVIFSVSGTWKDVLRLGMNFVIPFSVASYSKIQYYRQTKQ